MEKIIKPGLLIKGDIIVCNEKDSEELNDFSVFAMVINNNINEKKMLIQRHLKLGKLYCNTIEMPYSFIQGYYKLPDKNTVETVRSSIPNAKK